MIKTNGDAVDPISIEYIWYIIPVESKDKGDDIELLIHPKVAEYISKLEEKIGVDNLPKLLKDVK